MMEELKKLAERLGQRGSWIRKGFQEWLDMWSKATSELLNDSELQIMKVKKIYIPPQHADNYKVYYLERGHAAIFWLWYVSWNEEDYRDEKALDLNTADMETIRQIVLGLPDTMTKYADRLKSRECSYNEILALLPKQE